MVRRQTRGTLLPLVIVLTFVVIALGMELSLLSRQQLQYSLAEVEASKAQTAADAGLAQGMLNLSNNVTYTGSGGPATLAEGPEAYNVTVLQPGAALGDGQSVPSGCVYVRSTGTYPGAKSHESSAMAIVNAPVNGLFGVQTTSGVNMLAGALVDSYNSTIGPSSYGGNNATVSSNTANAGTVIMGAGAVVKGTVEVGPGGNTGPAPGPLTLTLLSPYSVWLALLASYNSAQVMTAPTNLPQINPPTPPNSSIQINVLSNQSLPPGNYGTLAVAAGTTLTLSPGAYTFSNIVLAAGASVQISGGGAAQVYVTQAAALAAGVQISNVNSPSSNFQLYLGPNALYAQAAGAVVTGVVYGPQATEALAAGAVLNGALVGQSATIAGLAAVHYDQALSTFNPLAATGNALQVLFRQRF